MSARFPLTPVQRGMAYVWRRDPRSDVNVEQWVVTLRERVDVGALRTAWNQSVAAHAALRTVFDLRDPTEPSQHVLPHGAGEFVETDWSDAAGAELDARFRAFLAEDRRRAFDLTAAPPWRVGLIRTAADCRFVCTYHHVLLDGRSLFALGRETFARYDALRGGAALTDDAEPPFETFVRAIRAADPSASQTYWRETLRDFTPPPSPFGRSVARVDDGRSAGSREAELRLPKEFMTELETFARACDVTPHTLVQAAWGLTLAAYTGVDDHVFGSVRACRKLPIDGIARMTGMLINTVPFRVRIDERRTVVEWLRDLRTQQVRLRDHETSSPADVARWAGLADGSALFPTLLLYTDRPAEAMFHDAAGRPHPTRDAALYERSGFPLALSAAEYDGLLLRLEYDLARCDAPDAEHLLETTAGFLHALLESADKSPAELPPVRGRLREKVLKWGRPEYAGDVVVSVPALFAAQVRRNPDATAVVAGERRLTYAALDRSADAAARGLRRCGVAAGDRIGVCLERSPECIAAVLGIWRIGAVYVPLDPKYPTNRLRAILDDAAPKVVACDDRSAERLELEPGRSIDAARLADPAASSEEGPIGEYVDLDGSAVVLYTSGSTGEPKGVVLTHRNLANHHAYVIRQLAFGPGDRLAPVSSLNFDASIEEMFCTLGSGATLCLPEAETLASFERFLEFIERNGLTILDLPTSLWRELTNYLYETRREYPASVRLIFMGGERATRESYRRFLKVGGRRMRWINAYGPTETTIFSTAYEHDPRRDADSTEPPPIGRPIDNTFVYVVDRRGRLVPPGATGELYVGGAGVAAGYLNRPDLTAERFVGPPSDDLPPGRYYRTGDAVRLRHDGVLEYVGRLDAQIKLRGFRIEPAEIESTLLRHPAVRDAAVTLRTSAAGTDYLAAYVVTPAGAAFDAAALKIYAQRHLPDYMVPAVFVELDALPTSPHGKVAYERLPEPTPADEEVEAPREPTELERIILTAWQATLGVSHVGLNDDFFALGGDSLKAMALTARLETSLGRTVPSTALWRRRTVAQLAGELAGDDSADLGPTVLLRDGDRRRPLFLIHSLGGDVWIYRDLVGRLRTEAAVFGIQLQGLDRVGTTPDDLRRCASDYLRHLRRLQPGGPYRLAGYSSGGLIALEMAAQLSADGEEVELLGLIDTGLPTLVEARRTASRWEQIRGVVGVVPACLRELRGIGWREGRRRIAQFAGRVARRLLAATRDGGGRPMSDREVLECFAEDISMFPPYRLELIKRHFEAIEAYEPDEYHGPVHLFRSARQSVFAVQTLTLGWETVVRGSLTVRRIRGAHATMLRSPFVDELAAALDDVLDATERRIAGGELDLTTTR